MPTKDEVRVDLLRRSLQAYYTGTGQGVLGRVVIPTVNHRTEVSLRLLDWLVTNYAKTQNVTYAHNGKPFSVFREYRTVLRAFTKRYFDPFCRRERITFSDGTHTAISTIGQLNFFRWAVQNGVIEYAQQHAEAIEQDMQREANVPRPEGAKRKAVVAPTAVFQCSSHGASVTIN